MFRTAFRRIVAAAAACSLAACGGGSGGSGAGLGSTPPPPPPPPPPPASPFGVTADTSFATLGEEVEFRWIESARTYEIRFPGKDWERLGSGYSTANYESHEPASGAYLISWSKNLDFQYTNLASHNANGVLVGQFAYGIPTAAGDVPTTGSATYSAQLLGEADYVLSGNVMMNFDFGKGTLTGHMHPILQDAWFAHDLGRYDFTQTVYSAGSTSFSGRFIVPGGGSTADSGFSGQFTGPGAAEVMAAWHAPFVDPYSLQWSMISGFWIGKKDK